METICSVVEAALSDQLMTENRLKMQSDQMLQAVTRSIVEGWPEDEGKLAHEVTPYFNYEEESSMNRESPSKATRQSYHDVAKRRSVKPPPSSDGPASNTSQSARKCILAKDDSGYPEPSGNLGSLQDIGCVSTEGTSHAS